MSDIPLTRRGGARPGAGRKRGSGPFGEPTTPIRLPVSLVPAVRAWLTARSEGAVAGAPQTFTRHPTALALPLYGSRIAAGVPSPADDDLEGTIDLNEHVVRHPAATFFLRVQGDSMIGAGIRDGDLLVVDRAREVKSGAIVVAAVNGELTLKRLKLEGERIWLLPENPDFQPLEIRDGTALVIWGVVAHTVHSF
ncbi:translesion error-prone DNA polymerase V autoproteolytic subunit [uncultured Thiodictyon sp.]|uniref:LexA family protein n=1 Tax=uncultured Thiodictyon sp. TaxID=1846217 RepID=UPI0025E657AA|nr:translesion error-prone DNA polymerase V autoproteolytic subunit [uncultured Thiodictyon sp.]